MPYVQPIRTPRPYELDQPSGGERIADALIAALQRHEARGNEDRQFRNSVAQAGGAVTEEGPSPRDRLRDVTQRWKRRPSWLGGSGGHATDDEVAQAQGSLDPNGPALQVTPSGADDAQPWDEVPRAPGGRPVFSERTTKPRPRPRGVAAAIEQNTPGGFTGGGRDLAPGSNLSGSRDGTTQGRATSIAAAIPSYKIKGPRGETATIDPTYNARVGIAGKAMEYEFERGVKRRDADEGDNQKIQSLIDAGMDPKEARARVLNNVVRYDETFGPQARGANAGLSFDQRKQLEQIKTQRATLIEGMRTARKNNDPTAARRMELQVRALDLRERALTMSALGTELKTEQDPSGIAGVMEGSTPEGKATQAGRATKRAGTVARIKDAAAGGKKTLGARLKELKDDGVGKDAARKILKREGFTLPVGW